MKGQPRTERVIAAAMKQLMQQKYLEDISVGEIIAESKISRNTFYYHFRDKYDLVNWIFRSEVPFAADTLSEGNWQETLYRTCAYLRENRAFYTNALRLTGQNSLQEYLIAYLTAQMHDEFYRAAKARHHAVPEKELEFAARFYAYAVVGLVAQWARDGMREDFATYGESLRRVLNGSLLDECLAPQPDAQEK